MQFSIGLVSPLANKTKGVTNYVREKYTRTT